MLLTNKKLNNPLLKPKTKIKIKIKKTKRKIINKKILSANQVKYNFLSLLIILVEEVKPKIVDNEDDGEGEWVTVTKKQKSGNSKKKAANDEYLELF